MFFFFSSVLIIFIYFFSSSIRKQSTADFVKKQLGNTVNKRILQLNVKHQDPSGMSYYSNSNEMFMPGSPSSNPNASSTAPSTQANTSNQIQPMSNLTVNTNITNNNNLIYQQQQQQQQKSMSQIMPSPVLMLNGQQTAQPQQQPTNSSSNDHLLNTNFSSPYSSSNMSMSPQQPNLISPSNNNYQQQKVQFNPQAAYSNQMPPDYNQSNQFNKFIRTSAPPPPVQQNSRFLLDHSNQAAMLNSSSANSSSFLTNDEFDLNFMSSNEPTQNPAGDDLEQKQLVQLIQQGGSGNNELNAATNTYGYQMNKQIMKSNQYVASANNATFYRQPAVNQYAQQASYSSYSTAQMYSNQMRMDQSSMYQQQQIAGANQSLMSFGATSSNDLINDEPGGNCSLLLD